MATPLSLKNLIEAIALSPDPLSSSGPPREQKQDSSYVFGSRFLTENDDVFSFNTWDHVELDDGFKDYAEERYALQREAPVSDHDKQRYSVNPAKPWNQFYSHHQANFFKDRNWLWQEFPALSEVTAEAAGPRVLLEIGAGAGNTAFPILAGNKNPALKIHACDYSHVAVDVIHKHDSYDPAHIQADVWDVTSTEELPPGLVEGTVDVALMIFIFSALSPNEWDQAVRNIYRLLKPSGRVCFRDYGRGDLSQVRFRENRYLEENFYVRGDGTRVYFFTTEELEMIWCRPQSAHVENPGFHVDRLAVDRRLIVNRARRIKMPRCWIQGLFVKQDKRGSDCSGIISDAALGGASLPSSEHSIPNQAT